MGFIRKFTCFIEFHNLLIKKFKKIIVGQMQENIFSLFFTLFMLEPWGGFYLRVVIPQGGYPPGWLSPRVVIPQGGYPPGWVSPRVVIPQGGYTLG